MGRGAATTAAATAKTAGTAAIYKGAKYAHEVKSGAQKGYQTTSVRVGDAQYFLQDDPRGALIGGFVDGFATPPGMPGLFPTSKYPLWYFLATQPGSQARQGLED